MVQTDLEVLLDMGFEKARAELALMHDRGLQGALAWLLENQENQDKPLEDLQAEAAKAEAAKAEAAKAADDKDKEEGGLSVTSLQEGDSAKSLVCKQCGKTFRSEEDATYHASKTEHTEFSESTEEFKRLTPEEREAKLAKARQLLLEKRRDQEKQDKKNAEENEKIRMKATKDSQALRAELQRKKQMEAAAQMKQERKDAEKEKKRIKRNIMEDQEARLLKAKQAEAARKGNPIATESTPAASASRPATTYTDARVKLQTPGGNLMKIYPAETTLLEIAQGLGAEDGIQVTGFSTTFPKKTYQDDLDFSKTLKEIGCVPSAVLIVHAT